MTGAVQQSVRGSVDKCVCVGGGGGIVGGTIALGIFQSTPELSRVRRLIH